MKTVQIAALILISLPATCFIPDSGALFAHRSDYAMRQDSSSVLLNHVDQTGNSRLRTGIQPALPDDSLQTGEEKSAIVNKIKTDSDLREQNLIKETHDLTLLIKNRQYLIFFLIVLINMLIIAALISYYAIKRKFIIALYHKEKLLDQQEENWQKRIALLKKILRGTPTTSDSDSDIKPLALSDLYTRFVELLETKRLYLNPDLNTKTLINLLGTNKKYLYQAISSQSEENFRSLINRYRVSEVKRLIEDYTQKEERFEITDIYTAAGFNSGVSFYRAFKQFTGLTPNEYVGETRRENRKRIKHS